MVAAVVVLTLVVPALGVVVQHGSLRVEVSAQLKPYKLPRTGTSPVDVFLTGHVASTDGATPPQLRRMEVKLNRHGTIDTHGLPRCHEDEIAPASDKKALAHCAKSLVGSGHFWASIVLPGQRSYHTTGRLLVFNGVRGGRPALFAHIYTVVPFPTSFVVTFLIHRTNSGPYSTVLSASLPQSLGDWGFVNRIKMTLGRRYRYRGERHGYINAGCPAPHGFRAAVFPLAVADLHFAGGEHLHALVTRPCGVRE